MMFMVPSDPAYGGTKWQIAKGHIDPGENARQAAIREGGEELGLVPSNIKSVAQADVSHQEYHGFDPVTLTVFVAEIKDPAAFTEPHYETGQTAWLTPEQFASTGRRGHQLSVRKAATLVRAKIIAKPLDKSPSL